MSNKEVPFWFMKEDHNDLSEKKLTVKQFHKQFKQRGKVTPIDSNKFPDRTRDGFEGPYRNRKTGLVFYYDRKAGQYYDPLSDIYLEVDDILESFVDRTHARNTDNLIRTISKSKDIRSIAKKIGVKFKPDSSDSTILQVVSSRIMNIGPKGVVSIQKFLDKSEGNTTIENDMVTEDGHDVFAGIAVFDVSTEEYSKCMDGRSKHERWNNKLDMAIQSNESIRSYSHRNPRKPIIVRDSVTGVMSFLKKEY